jgi:microcystin-dependent protein
MSQPYLGEIRMFPWEWAPKRWALCAGQLLPIAQNSALFALLGVTYGGNGTTTFALPDLRGRAPMSTGQLPGGQYYIEGQASGVEDVTLIQGQLPMHNHLFLANGALGDAASPLANYLAGARSGAVSVATYAAPGATVPLAPDMLGMTGGAQPHDNMQPYLVMNYCIALQGVFPARN